jgi:hypothetical protein
MTEKSAKGSSAVPGRLLLLLSAALLLAAPLAEASVPRTSAVELAPATATSLTLTLAPDEPGSSFALFVGDEVARAAHAYAEGFHPLVAVSLLAEDESPDLASELELREPETRIGGQALFPGTRIGAESRLSLDLRWACEVSDCELVSGNPQDPLGLANDIDIRSNPDVRAEYCKRVPKDCSIWEREPVPMVDIQTTTSTGNAWRDLGALYSHGLNDYEAPAALARRYPGGLRERRGIQAVGKAATDVGPFAEFLFMTSQLFALPIPEGGAFIELGSGTEMAEAAVASRNTYAASRVTWVDESASMPARARAYQSGTTGARSNVTTQKPQAPALTYRSASGTDEVVRFDGLSGDVLIDRKTSVTTFPKSQQQALRQSEALRQNGLRGRWEVTSPGERNRAKKMLKELGIDNIDVSVVKAP